MNILQVIQNQELQPLQGIIVPLQPEVEIHIEAPVLVIQVPGKHPAHIPGLLQPVTMLQLKVQDQLTAGLQQIQDLLIADRQLPGRAPADLLREVQVIAGLQAVEVAIAALPEVQDPAVEVAIAVLPEVQDPAVRVIEAVPAHQEAAAPAGRLPHHREAAVQEAPDHLLHHRVEGNLAIIPAI